MIKVGICGVSGFLGAESARLIYQHPNFELTYLAAGETAGKTAQVKVVLAGKANKAADFTGDFDHFHQRVVRINVAAHCHSEQASLQSSHVGLLIDREAHLLQVGFHAHRRRQIEQVSNGGFRVPFRSADLTGFLASIGLPLL